MTRNEPKWAKYITEDTIDDERLQSLISVIGFEATKKLMIHFAGSEIFIPKTCTQKYKHQYILDNYDGTKVSRMKLVLECDITESYIYKIINKYKDKKCI